MIYCSYVLHPWCFLYLATAIAPLAFHTLRVSPVEYLQLWGRFFNGITLPEARPMDVEPDWLGAIKQSLEGSSDHSPWMDGWMLTSVHGREPVVINKTKQNKQSLEGSSDHGLQS